MAGRFLRLEKPPNGRVRPVANSQPAIERQTAAKTNNIPESAGFWFCGDLIMVPRNGGGKESGVFRKWFRGTNCHPAVGAISSEIH